MSSLYVKPFRLGAVVAELATNACCSHFLSKVYPETNRTYLIVATTMTSLAGAALQHFTHSMATALSKRAGYIKNEKCINNYYYILAQNGVLAFNLSMPLVFIYGPLNLRLPNYPATYACLSLPKLAGYFVSNLTLIVTS